eukprot:g850.t1
MVKKFFVGGNWKLNGTPESVKELVGVLNEKKPKASADVVVFPTALHIMKVQETLDAAYAVGAQNFSTDKGFGAYTGELSAELFAAAGVKWTLVGHSERRRRQQTRNLGHDESIPIVAKKVTHALKSGLNVVVCIGETLGDREQGKTMEVCQEQLQGVRTAIPNEAWDRVVIAYEPVWAIGTGVSATPEQAQEIHEGLRKWFAKVVSDETAAGIRIIYGGSVKGKNAADLIAQPDIDGFLVGGASLKPDFHNIIAAVPDEPVAGKRKAQVADASAEPDTKKQC